MGSYIPADNGIHLSKIILFLQIISQIPVRANVYYTQIPVHHLTFDAQIPTHYLAFNAQIPIILISICDSSTHYSFHTLRFFICIHAKDKIFL